MKLEIIVIIDLLDLSAAFDCVDHDILLCRLRHKFGIYGTALEWLASFLLGRSQQVYYKGRLSVKLQLVFGVPQGSVLGPLLFLLYTAELFDVITECGCTGHAYADDTQFCVSTPAEDHSDAVDRLTSCIIRVRGWMANNRLKLNEDKTQVIWLGTRQQLDKTLEQQNATVPFSSVVDDFGVLLDNELTMANHIVALSRSCFFHLRRLRSIKQSLTPDANKSLVHAFVSNRLDCCNSLLAGVSNQLLQRLQVVQNAAARLVTGARRSEHMSPILCDLHWLPVRQQIIFKTAILAYKCQHGMAPGYPQVYCQPTSTVACRRLRSADSGRLAVGAVQS